MRNLRLYNTEAEFRAYEESKGGDGLSVQTVFPGASMVDENGNIYYSPHSETVSTFYLTVNYVSELGTAIAPSDIQEIKYYPGKTQDIILTPKNVPNYAPIEALKKVSIPDTNSVDFIYYKNVKKNFKDEYLTFEIISGGTIRWRTGNNTSTYKKTIEYSKNNGSWTSITSATGNSAPSITVVAGDVVQFRGNNGIYGTSSYINCFSASTTNLRFNAYGNVMSLVNSTDFKNMETLSSYSHYIFRGLFSGCTSLVGAQNLILPATNLNNSDGAYDSMFFGCTRLTTAPDLPATTLSYTCYQNMFRSCTGLTQAPELPAIELESHCYSYMFSGCSNLNCIKAAFTTTPSTAFTWNWVLGVASTGTFYKNPEATWTTTGVNAVPTSWTVVTGETISLPETNKYVSQNGGSSEVQVFASSNWSASTDSSWIKLLKANGTYADTTAVFYATPSSEPRTGTIVFRTGTKEAVLTVRQNENYFIPLTFDIISGGTLYWKYNGSATAYARTIEYKLNENNWVSIKGGSGSSAPSIVVNAGDIVQFRGNNSSYSVLEDANANFFSASSETKFGAKGNIMSLAYSSNFVDKVSLSGTTRAFLRLFSGCTSLTTAPELPATKLGENCYAQMFAGCSNLTTAPVLPATALTGSCYAQMFADCTSLTTAPELPATKLANYCYARMFDGCSNLTTATELPATDMTNGLMDYCYYNMFANCTSLTTAPNELPATTLGNRNYYGMFSRCTSLVQAPEILATGLGYYGCSYMFAGCTSLTGGVTTLGNSATTAGGSTCLCMFSDCTSLITPPKLPATTMGYEGYKWMFDGCTSLVTAPELPATTLDASCYAGMFRGCTNLNYIKCLATDISATSCLNGWVNGVASSGTFIKHPNMSSWTTGTSGIPENWTVQDATV